MSDLRRPTFRPVHTGRTGHTALALAAGLLVCGGFAGSAFAQTTVVGMRSLSISVAEGATRVLDTDAASGRSTGSRFVFDTTFTKRGAGIVELVGSGTDFFNSTAQEGLLDNRTTGGIGAVFVDPAGVYTGTSAAESVDSQGRVNPGVVGGIGESFISDAYVQRSGAVLDIEFGSGGVDLLRLGGTVSLLGDVNFVELDAGVQTDVALAFLEVDPSGAPLTERFENTTVALLADTGILGANVSYRTFGADVTFEAVELAPAFEETQNFDGAREVARLVDAIAAGSRGDAAARSGFVPVVDALLNANNLEQSILTQANLPASAAVAVVPENQTLATSAALARLPLGLAFLQNRRGGLSSRNADLLLAQRSPGDSGFSLGLQGTESALDSSEAGRHEALAATLPGAAGVFRPIESGPSLFAQALGSFSQVDADGNSLAQDSESYGVTFGGDWALEEWNAVGGVFFAFIETDTGVDGLADSLANDAFQVGLYGAKRFGRHTLLAGTATASLLTFDSQRSTELGTATGSADGFVVGGTLEALCDIPLGEGFVLSPLIALEAFAVERDAYSESGAGAFNLDVRESSGEFLTTVVGAQAATTATLDALGGWRVSPLVRLGWSRQHLDRSGSTTSSFSAAPGETFVTRSAARERDALRVGAALELRPPQSEAWSVFARYSGDIAANGDSHTVRAGLRLFF